MKYNKHYRKLITKSIDSQRVWKESYLDGMEASEWVTWAQRLSWLLKSESYREDVR